MSYKTPHTAHEYMKAAALAVVHQYVLAVRGLAPAGQKNLLLARREIDFNSRLALFFGPEAMISAQGVSGHDLTLDSPKLKVEIKYLRPNQTKTHPVNSYEDVKKDWDWLLGLSSNGNVFRQSAWVVFLPSTKVFSFHKCFHVPKKYQIHGEFPAEVYAPFFDLATPNPANPKELHYTTFKDWERDALLQRQGSKVLVRREIVGNIEHPVWCIVYSRVGSKTAGNELQRLEKLVY